MGEGAATGMAVVVTAVKTALADFSTTSLASVITAGLSIAVPLVLGWFAFRWIYKKAKGAIKKGV